MFDAVFSIVFCDDDEQALQALQGPDAKGFDAIFIEYSNLEAILSSPLLEAGEHQVEAQKILLNADISLDGLIQMLASQRFNKCFSRPYDANLIKSTVYAAKMRIQEPLRPAFCQEQAQLRVLVVDDEVDATKYLKKNLQLLGAPFDILCAANAQEALDLLEQHKSSIAVIVSDQKMPGMQGSQLLNKIRNIQPNMVRILTSAYGEVDVAMNAMNEGSIFQYIKKPWDAKQVLSCINQALDRHCLLQQQSLQSLLEIDRHQQHILATRKRQINAALGETIDGLARQGVLNEFLSCLGSIAVSAPYSPVTRAGNSEEFEAQLLKALCEAVQPKLDEMARLSTLQGDTQQDFIRAWGNKGSQQTASLGAYLSQSLAQALAVLMSASAMPAGSCLEEVSPSSIRISLPKPLKIYSHLLGPLKTISERFIQQQAALLMIFVIAGTVQGELGLDCEKQSLGLCFTCTTAGRG